MAGRPRKEIDQTQFENLCHIQCTLEEISNWFQCHEDTIREWCKRTYKENFPTVYKKYSDGGKMSLRRIQFRLAEKNAAMAIWLGKQYLGQRDTFEVTHEGLDKVADLMKALDKEADVE